MDEKVNKGDSSSRLSDKNMFTKGNRTTWRKHINSEDEDARKSA